MAKTTTKTTTAAPTKGRVLPDLSQEHNLAETPNLVFAGDQAQPDTSPKTVVPVGYKTAYRARAAAMGLTSKAHKRSNCDWLAQELAEECVGKGGIFALPRFLAIFFANTGTDALARWPSRTNGWEGRLRMSGAIVLRGVVGKSGVFRTPESETKLGELAANGDSLAAEFLAKWDGRNS
jgi:hypothetical protein